eukprot:scaffold164599_cov19-Tisochrysis_lutea.AAC.1
MQAQVLNDGAAQKKLGKIKHTADAVPVMFFGTLEIAWIGQSDIVCFKDGVLQGFLVKGKHKSFLKACGQVYEFLMLDKKRRAPQYWWCRAPSNGKAVCVYTQDSCIPNSNLISRWHSNPACNIIPTH